MLVFRHELLVNVQDFAFWSWAGGDRRACGQLSRALGVPGERLRSPVPPLPDGHPALRSLPHTNQCLAGASGKGLVAPCSPGREKQGGPLPRSVAAVTAVPGPFTVAGARPQGGSWDGSCWGPRSGRWPLDCGSLFQ